MSTTLPRRAVRQARTADFWGTRRRQASQQGPAAEYAVAADQLRAAIGRLPENQRQDATRRAIQMLDQLRQTIADS
jgi:hypothetical protein